MLVEEGDPAPLGQYLVDVVRVRGGEPVGVCGARWQSEYGTREGPL